MDSNQYGNNHSENGSNAGTQPNQPNNVNYYDIPPEQSPGQGSAYDSSLGQGETYQDPYGQTSGSYNLNGKQYNYGDAYQGDASQGDSYQNNQGGSYQNNQGSTYQSGAYGNSQNNAYQTSQNTSYQTGGYQSGSPYAANKPANEKEPPFTLYIVFSVIEMFFSAIFGIIALVCSILGMQQYQKGDYSGGRGKLKAAKIILIIGMVCGILAILIICIAFIMTSSVGSVVKGINESNNPSVYSELGGDDEKMGELSSDWEDFKVALDGEVYELPCKTEQLTGNGWVLDKDYEDATVEAGYFKPVLYRKGDYQIGVVAANFSSEEMKAEDCMIGGFTIEGRYVNDGLTFSICQGISLGTDMEKAKQVMGKPDDEYIGDDNGYWEDYRAWTYNGSDYVYQSVRFTLIDYQITSIDIQNINEE